MASAQAISPKYDLEQKEIVQKLVEKAKSIAKSSSKFNAVAQEQMATVVALNNNTQNIVFKYTMNDWSGKIIGEYPELGPHSEGDFTHVGVPGDGSEGAVVYSGYNNSGVDCGWLLAWDTPTNLSETNPNRIYVECGPMSKYANIDWSAIKAKLDVGSSEDGYFDASTQTTITAKIDPAINSAAVGATFRAM